MIAGALVPSTLVHVLARVLAVPLVSFRTGCAYEAAHRVFAFGLRVTAAIIAATFVNIVASAATRCESLRTLSARVGADCIGAFGTAVTHTAAAPSAALIYVFTSPLVMVAVESSGAVKFRVTPVVALVHPSRACSAIVRPPSVATSNQTITGSPSALVDISAIAAPAVVPQPSPTPVSSSPSPPASPLGLRFGPG